MIEHLATVVEVAESAWWEQWLTPAGISGIVRDGGLVLLAWLFFTGKIITSKQHDLRVADVEKAFDGRTADLIENHARELAQKDATYDAVVGANGRAYSEMKESRDYYRGARLEEKNRADRATEQLIETNEIARAATHALVALSDQAAALSEGEPR